MKQLNFHHLMYFREIAMEGSVSKAAIRLRIGQPTLSEQLRILEESLGHKLFDRVNRKMILTDAGKHVLKCANDIYKTGAYLWETIDHGIGTSRAILRIGVVNSVPKHLVLKLVSDAQKINLCRITIIEGRADELLREIQAHALDILISNFPAPTTEWSDIFSRSLAKSKISIYGSKGFKSLKNNFPASLNGQYFILPTSDSKLRHDIEHYLKINDLRAEVFAETHDTSIQKLIGAEGYGLLVLPEFSTVDLIKEKKLFKLGTMAGVFEEFWIISSKRIVDNPTALKLINEFSFSLESIAL